MLINMETGLGRVRGNQKLYTKMLGMFLASEDPKKLEDALLAGDLAAAAEAAHTVKGVAGNLSLDDLFEQSSALMDQLRAGAANDDTLAAYRKAYQDTVKEVEATIARLQG